MDAIRLGAEVKVKVRSSVLTVLVVVLIGPVTNCDRLNVLHRPITKERGATCSGCSTQGHLLYCCSFPVFPPDSKPRKNPCGVLFYRIRSLFLFCPFCCWVLCCFLFFPFSSSANEPPAFSFGRFRCKHIEA